MSVRPQCGTGDELTKLTEGGWSFQDQPNILHDALHGVSEAFVPGVRDYVILILLEVDPVGPRTEHTAHNLYAVRYQLPMAPVTP